MWLLIYFNINPLVIELLNDKFIWTIIFSKYKYKNFLLKNILMNKL